MANKLILCGIVSALALSACSTVTGGLHQEIKVDTKTADGTVISNAKCQITNNKDYSVDVSSGDSVQIRRGSQNLAINCQADNQAPASGTLISRSRKAALAGNWIIGGGGLLGTVTDVASGSMYRYPEWIELFFGESRIYDAKDSQSGKPNQGKIPEKQ